MLQAWWKVICNQIFNKCIAPTLVFYRQSNNGKSMVLLRKFPTDKPRRGRWRFVCQLVSLSVLGSENPTNTKTKRFLKPQSLLMPIQLRQLPTTTKCIPNGATKSSPNFRDKREFGSLSTDFANEFPNLRCNSVL